MVNGYRSCIHVQQAILTIPPVPVTCLVLHSVSLLLQTDVKATLKVLQTKMNIVLTNKSNLRNVSA
jgi:hypothetical protein